MALSYSKVDKIITVLSPDTEITIQNLLNSIRDYEDELTSMDIPKIVSCAGKESLGGGVQVGLTLTLLDDWQLAFEARGGPTYIQCKVSGGNIVADHVDGSIYPTAFTQVLITASSSATQSDIAAIQYASFGGGVSYDIIVGVAGTEYNIGTIENPSNNFADGLSIATERGFSTFFIGGDATLNSSTDFEEMIFVGESKTKSIITIASNADVENCEFYDAEIKGVLDGGNVLKNCLIGDINYVNGYIEQCVLKTGRATLGGGAEAHYLDCWSGVVGTAIPIIDMGGSGQGLSLKNYNGAIRIENKSGPEKIIVDLNSGQVVIDSTSVIAGEVICRGIGSLVDENGTNISTGTWNGVTITNELVNPISVADAVWNADLTDYNIPNSAGHALKYRTFNNRVCIDVVNGTAGTAYPLGLADSPSNNLADAKLIAAVYNIRELYLYSNLTIGATEKINDYVITAPQDIDILVNLTAGCTTKNTRFFRVIVMGTFNGKSYVETCTMLEVFNFSGFCIDVIFMDNIAIVDPLVNSLFHNCGGGKVSPAIEVDLNDSNLNVGGWKGEAILINKTGSGTNIIEMMSGEVTITDTCIAGTIVLKGLGRIIADNSGPGCTIISTDLHNNDFTFKIIKNKKVLKKVGSSWFLIIYDDDGITEILNKEILDKDGNAITDLEAGVLAQESGSTI